MAVAQRSVNTLGLHIKRVNRWQRLYRNGAALCTAAGMILLLQWLTTIPSTPTPAPDTTPTNTAAVAENPGQTQAAMSAELGDLSTVPIVDSSVLYPMEYHEDLHAGSMDKLRQKLLNQAMRAVKETNPVELANTLKLLGITALSENNIDSANVYLQEALAVFEEIGDELGSAKVHLHIGRMHIIERQMARRAAIAYDAGLLARLKISHGLFHEAAPMLHRAIEENIELSRYGAAARDYEALSSNYLEYGQWDEAARAGVEAAKLHAASGRPEKAEKIITGLLDSQVINIDLESLNAEMATLSKDYQDSVEQIGRARDYQQLYHHFIAEGDPVRAWQFRLQADASLKKASKRARYRRQAGVLVLLYNSNDSMQKAKRSLSTAHNVFTAQSQETMAAQSEQLLTQVY